VIRKVVNISSMAGTHGNAGQVNYSSAKSALVGMTKTMSKEWGRYKVCVNCVAFGFIETRLTKPNDDPATLIEIEGKAIQAGVPAAMLGRSRRWCRSAAPERPTKPRAASISFASPKAIISADR
jgi:3-oxoacyl-[acyl-carrier protein] reductase